MKLLEILLISPFSIVLLAATALVLSKEEDEVGVGLLFGVVMWMFIVGIYLIIN